MKILFLCRSLEVGGAERQLALLASGLAARGHDVAVATFYADGALESDLDDRVRLLRLNKRGRYEFLGFLLRLLRVLSDEKPDVLQSYLGFPNVLTLLAPLATRSRIVLGVRASNMDHCHYDRWRKITEKLEIIAGWRSHLVIANSEAGARHAVGLGFPADRFAVVWNGIDTERFRPDGALRERQREAWGLDRHSLAVGLVGRIDPMKDHANFLAAGARLAERRPDLRLVCIGGYSASSRVRSNYESELRQRADALGLAGRVRWVRACSDMSAAYNALDVCCLASRFGEGFPNVVGEAMACGTPCAVTDVGDSAAIVGPLGCVAPPGDPEALARAIESVAVRLAAERGLRDQVRERAVALFSDRLLIERSERLLAQLVAKAAGQPMGKDEAFLGG